MKVKIGKYYKKDVVGVFSNVLENDGDFEFVVAGNTNNERFDVAIMSAATIAGATLRLKDQGWSFDQIIETAKNAYENGWDK